MYLKGFIGTENSAEYKNYLNSSIKYMMTSLRAEIKKNHPEVDLDKIDYNDPKWKPIVEKLAYRPIVMGSLANSLGLDDKVLTEEVWEDLFNGWIHSEILPEDSHLRGYARETPKGMMVPLSNNPGKFDEKGGYVYDGLRKPTDEALFTLGKGLSIYLVAKEIEEPGTLLKVQEIHNKVMREYIIPEIEKLSRTILRENGELTEKDGYEIMTVDFMHIDSRGKQPHVHFHSNFINSIMGKDGRLFANQAFNIYEHKALIDGMYMARMKDLMEKSFHIPFVEVMLKSDEENEHLPEEQRVVSSYDISTDIVPAELVDYYSERIKEIERAIKEQHLESTPGTREIAQKSTRDDKSEIPPSELLAMWKEEFKELGYSTAEIVSRANGSAPKLNYIPITDRQITKNFVRKHFEQTQAKQLLAHSKQEEAKLDDEVVVIPKKAEKSKKKTAQEAFFSAKFDSGVTKSLVNKLGKVDFRLAQFTGHVVKQAIATCDADTAFAEADRIAEQELRLYLPKERYEYFKPFLEGKITDKNLLEKMKFAYQKEARFITNYSKHQSDFIGQSWSARKDEDRWLVPEEIINEEIMKYEARKGFQLSPDQVADIKATFTEKGALVNTAGMAGTGKTTATEVKVIIAERMGWEVWGTSVSNTATKGLAKDANIKNGRAYNSAKFIRMMDEGKIQLHRKCLVFFDEAGMASIDDIYRFTQHLCRAGAKVNFCGEKEQLQPVGPANGFKFLNENFTTIPLTSINRQKKAEDRANVKLWQAGKSQEAMEDLYDRGYVKITKTNMDSFELVAQLYVDADRPDNEKIIMSALNGDNDYINNLIKSKLQDKGVLDKNTEQIKVKCIDDVEREFGKGDRIAIFKNTQTDDYASDGQSRGQVDNSDPGTIKYLQKNRLGRVTAFCLEMDKIDPKTGEKEIRFLSADKLVPFRHGWAGTVHKAQGASKALAWKVVTHAHHDAFSEYVSASRHKEEYTLIMSEEFKDKSIHKLRDKEPVEKQVNKLDWLKTQGIEVPELAYDNFKNAHLFLKDYIQLQMPGAENKTHALDDFSNIVSAFGQQNFKKNVSDYTEIKGGLALLKAIQKEREQDMEDFKALRGSIKTLEKVVSKPIYLRNKKTQAATKDIPIVSAKQEKDKPVLTKAEQLSNQIEKSEAVQVKPTAKPKSKKKGLTLAK